jgi:hypothetical protein
LSRCRESLRTVECTPVTRARPAIRRKPATNGFACSRRNHSSSIGGEGGLPGLVAFFLASISWFTIIIAGVQIYPPFWLE